MNHCATNGENRMILRSLVLSRYPRVTNGQTDKPSIAKSQVSWEQHKSLKSQLTQLAVKKRVKVSAGFVASPIHTIVH